MIYNKLTYPDYKSTAPIDFWVSEVMLPFFQDNFANPRNIG